MPLVTFATEEERIVKTLSVEIELVAIPIKYVEIGLETKPFANLGF